MKTVIFDLDGTLLDVRRGVYWQFQQLTLEFDGQPVDKEIVNAAMGGTTDDIIRFIVKNRQVAFETIKCRHEQLFRESLAMRELYPDVKELLGVLHNLGYKIAALTSGSEHTLSCMNQQDIGHLFHKVVSAKDVSNHKPHPEGINLILKHFDAKHDKAVMVGDTVNDILAGKNGRVAKTIGVTHGFGNELALRAAGADHIVHDIPAILDVLE